MSRKKDSSFSGGRGAAAPPSEPGRANRRPHPAELRLRVVREVMERGARQVDVARLLGLSPATVAEWIRRFRQLGAEGLEDGKRATALTRSPGGGAADIRREAVTKLRSEHPEYGTRRIRDVLA